MVDKRLLQREHAALALDELDHHGTDVAGKRLVKCIAVICWSVGKALGEGEEVLVEHVLARFGEGGHRATVE